MGPLRPEMGPIRPENVPPRPKMGLLRPEMGSPSPGMVTYHFMSKMGPLISQLGHLCLIWASQASNRPSRAWNGPSQA